MSRNLTQYRNRVTALLLDGPVFRCVLITAALIGVLGCWPGTAERDLASTDTNVVSRDHSEASTRPAPVKREWALAIHGGAGAIPRDDGKSRDPYFESLRTALSSGRHRLEQGDSALDVVESVVTQLEDDPLFNAGRGAVFTSRGTHELDAAIMDGRSLSCGAVAGLINVRNPIALARAVMQKSPHVLLAGAGAEEFGREMGVRRAAQSYFTTAERFEQWQEERRKTTRTGGPPDSLGHGTVGAVALDQYGNLAAGTSTGGITNKTFGRLGDVPIIGAGTYADNQTAAISCTGKGEEFIRHSVAFDVSARMKYLSESLEEAARHVIDHTLRPGDGGLIAVDSLGRITFAFNTDGMYRASADSEGLFAVGIWQEMRSESPTGRNDEKPE